MAYQNTQISSRVEGSTPDASSSALAEDLTSETFVRVLYALDSLRWQGRDDVGGWLAEIARNILIAHYPGPILVGTCSIGTLRARQWNGAGMGPAWVKASGKKSSEAFIQTDFEWYAD